MDFVPLDRARAPPRAKIWRNSFFVWNRYHRRSTNVVSETNLRCNAGYLDDKRRARHLDARALDEAKALRHTAERVPGVGFRQTTYLLHGGLRRR
jgi:hypothetical protein